MIRLASDPPELFVSLHRENGLQAVSLAGEADIATEHRLVPALRQAVLGANTLVLDLSGLRFCSVRSVETMAELMASAAHRGVRVAVAGLSRVTTRVWLLTGLPIPQQYATLSAAVAALRPLTTGPHDALLALGDEQRADLVLVAVAELNSVLLTEQPLSSSLREVASAVLRAVPEATQATVTAAAESGRRVFVTVDEAHHQPDEQRVVPDLAPYAEAAASGRTVVLSLPAPEPAAEGTQQLTEQAGAHGVHQVLAVPLHAGAGGVGAIALYVPGPPLSRSVVEHVHDLAAHAAVVVANAAAHAAAKDTAAQLLNAMQSRAMIDQATGIVMARFGYSPEQAFALLRQRSQETNRKVREVAADLVSAGPEALVSELR